MIFIEHKNQKTRKGVMSFGIKTKQSFTMLILALVIICLNKEAFAQNNTDPKSAKFICTNDNGFILKEKGFPFLIANSLIDTTKKIKGWKRINQNDTIGRYYRINNSDNYLMCLPHQNPNQSAFFIILINVQGDLVKSETYNLYEFHKWDTYYREFYKQEDFFILIEKNFLHHGDYQNLKMYVFKELVPQDSIKSIRLQELIVTKNSSFKNHKYKEYWSTLKFEGNQIIVHYKLYRGKIIIHKDLSATFKHRYFPKKRITVKYIYENSKWKTNDTIQLKKIEDFLEVDPCFK